MPDGASTAGELLDAIRRDSPDSLQKGESFEKLFKLLILQLPEFEVKEAHRWKEWPARENETDLPLYDSGIDMVAKLNDGSLVAIQCKCYNEDYRVSRGDIDKFLAVSGPPFDLRWFVATCGWGKRAEDAMRTVKPPVRRIDFHDYDGIRISEGKVESRAPRRIPQQEKAVESVVTRMAAENRGQLIMACGTGKTYVSLRIAERLVPDGGRILFLAPSIALVSQARREWLRFKTRPLRGLVVCSDRTSGGRGENEDIHTSELECRVTTDPKEIASALEYADATGVIFCTYQSLGKVSKAQLAHGAPDFDLIIADEAHRTTGVERQTGFHTVHKSDALRGKKRLYLTATPRVYTPRSKRALKSRGYGVYDMEDFDRFGEVMHRLTFKKAVKAGMLSDYRVIVMAVREDDTAHSIYNKFLTLVTSENQERTITYRDAERLLGTALAINGITERGNAERLPRVLGFANSRKRSRAFRDMLKMPDLHKTLADRMGDGDSVVMHAVEHLDGNSSALERNRALRDLENANARSPRMICNVRLFTEGVDIPSLNAVAFLDPRDSMVDIVQAVGRVMRKAEGKRFGYIIIPVPVIGDDLTGELEARDGWTATSRVLSALQSHDSRLPENPAQFLEVYDPLSENCQSATHISGIQDTLEFQEFSEKIYTKVVASSGLAKPGQIVTEDIESAVGSAGHSFMKSAGLAGRLADVLGLKIDSSEYTGVHICKIAALLVINACLLHRRLQEHMAGLTDLGDVSGSADPRATLMDAWGVILDKDYAPVFEPALNVMEALPGDTKDAIYRLADRANSMADSLSELGYDHSGPLYHKVLGTAKSDSANYTDNVSALMLARLALSDDFTDWSDAEGVARLRIMDPACGTGTLLMAAMKTIKDRMGCHIVGDETRHIHRRLVEDVLCGLDINRHAIQLAACNLTLGAPSIDYKNINLYTVKHGPQPGGNMVKAGSLEILRAVGGQDAMVSLVQPMRRIGDMQAEHIADTTMTGDTLNSWDVVIMNPPFGSNKSRNRKFHPDVVRRMQKNELDIRAELKRRDREAGETIDSNSVSTFFTPLADRLLDARRGTLAKVLPVTACTNASGLDERKFLAERFHVERIITSHDPKHPNFSYKTGIHESLMICRRHDDDANKPTEFIALRRMPKTAKEAIRVADAIADSSTGKWYSACRWPAERVKAGDWSPVQWCDDSLADIILELESSDLLEPIGYRYEIGPAGQRIYDAYEKCNRGDVGAVRIFESISAKLRKTIYGAPESWHKPKPSRYKKRLAKRYWKQRSTLLVAKKFRTTNGRLTALYSDEPSVGKGWTPVGIDNECTAKALAVWWNSTPVKMMLLNRRSKLLDYPQWSLAHLREIRIPRPDNPKWNILAETYKQVCDRELLPMSHVDDPARVVIDNAAAKALNLKPEVLAGWRERLSKEPTISNQRAEVADG